jgi:hypothetical protein
MYSGKIAVPPGGGGIRNYQQPPHISQEGLNLECSKAKTTTPCCSFEITPLLRSTDGAEFI